jgi:hypothetical protein
MACRDVKISANFLAKSCLKIDCIHLSILIGKPSDLLGEELFKTTFTSFSSLLHCHLPLFHPRGLVSASHLWQGIFLNTPRSVQIKTSSSPHRNFVTSMVYRAPIHKLAGRTRNSTLLCDRFYTNPVLLVTLSTEGTPFPTNFRSWCQKKVSLLWVRRPSHSTISWWYSELLFFLISNFRRVLNVVCFLLGNCPACEFYMPTFRNIVCCIFIDRYLPAY